MDTLKVRGTSHVESQFIFWSFAVRFQGSGFRSFRTSFESTADRMLVLWH